MTTVSEPRTSADRLARLITDLFAPAHLAIGLLLVVGTASGASHLRGLAWGALAALVVGAMPYAWILYSVRRGRLTSRHIPDRAQRILPLALAAVLAGAGLALLVALGAPRQLVALVLAMLAGLAVTAAVTTVWKISIHGAVAGGTAIVLTVVFGPVLLVSSALVVAIGWSRVQQHGHTIRQVVAGALLGVLVAALFFIPLR